MMLKGYMGYRYVSMQPHGKVGNGERLACVWGFCIVLGVGPFQLHGVSWKVFHSGIITVSECKWFFRNGTDPLV